MYKSLDPEPVFFMDKCCDTQNMASQGLYSKWGFLALHRGVVVHFRFKWDMVLWPGTTEEPDPTAQQSGLGNISGGNDQTGWLIGIPLIATIPNMLVSIIPHDHQPNIIYHKKSLIFPLFCW
jgi:hypothetical protein